MKELLTYYSPEWGLLSIKLGLASFALLCAHSRRRRGRVLSNKDLQNAEWYGGSDFHDWEEYKRNPNRPSYDKGGHKERSMYHQPNHSKHWNKQE